MDQQAPIEFKSTTVSGKELGDTMNTLASEGWGLAMSPAQEAQGDGKFKYLLFLARQRLPIADMVADADGGGRILTLRPHA